MSNKFYGLSKKIRKEKRIYRLTKAKAYLRLVLSMSKKSKKARTWDYKSNYTNDEKYNIQSKDNSIADGKYYTPISFITYDLISKENIDSVKKALLKLVTKNTCNKFMGIGFQRESSEDFLENLNYYLGSWGSWLNCGRFDFGDRKSISRYIDYFDIKLRNFSSSYFVIESSVYFTKDATQAFNEIINSNCTEPLNRISTIYTQKGKRKIGAKKNLGVAKGDGGYTKAQTIYNQLLEIKWSYYHELSHFFILVMHSNNVVPPSTTLYKTNIHYDEAFGSFWRSVGIYQEYGHFIDPSNKLFFDINLNSILSQHVNHHDMYFIVNEEVEGFKEMYANFNSQVTHEFSDSISEKVFKLHILSVLNNLHTDMFSKYRNKNNKINLNKRSYSKLLKLRYKVEKSFILFNQLREEVNWENEIKSAKKLFSRVKSDKYQIADIRILTDSVIIAFESLEKNRKLLKTSIENKLEVVGHMSEYGRERKNFAINIITLIVTLITLLLIFYPDWVEVIAGFFTNIFFRIGKML